MKEPLVSVICLCYNQAKYVEKAIQSVWDQDYPNVELIVVDDASQDGSQSVIQNKLSGSDTKFVFLDQNVGNCKAFNMGFAQSHGQYIIDLAADDMLLSNRISEGVKSFKQRTIGVHFCDSYWIDASGNKRGTHYNRNNAGTLLDKVPDGDIYVQLIKKYFISPPTMMIKREVLEALGGYDESLTYEDFDFWIRSSRHYNYGFTDQILVEKRTLKDSLSASQFRFRSRHQRSTLKVCEKIKILNQSPEENKALRQRVWYETRQCLIKGNIELIPGFLKLLF